MKPVKLTWHDGNQVWSKVVGKKLSRCRTRLVQAQWYFTTNREESETLAAARKAEWRRIVKGWASHQTLLEAMAEPFAGSPHWYNLKPTAQKTPQLGPTRDEKIETLRRESQPTQSDVAQMYEDMDVAECASLFMAYRQKRVGIDFSAPTNKSFKTDLDGALRAINQRVRMVELSLDDLDEQRAALVQRCKSSNTAKNYGRAMKMLLDWYYDSPYFFGGTKPKGIDEVFARYPKRRPAKPKHLQPATLKAVFEAASQRRRLYLLLMLNTGMQPTDIPPLNRSDFDLDGSMVRWHRNKNERVMNPADHEIISHLWPETVSAVGQHLAAKDGPAFLTVNGRPLYHESAKKNRQNAVTKSLAKFFGRLSEKQSIEVSAKNFRQTGGQMIHEVTGDYELSKIWLGRQFDMVDRSYLKGVYLRLDAAAAQVREILVRSNVFDVRNAGGSTIPD